MKGRSMKGLPALACACLLLLAASCYAGESSLGVSICRVSDDAVMSSVTFPLPGVPQQSPADEYLRVMYRSTMTYWTLDIYTDNTTASDALIQRAGLLNQTTNMMHIPLLWRVYASTQAGGVPVGVIDWNNLDWAWLKDKGDRDDPATLLFNESWASSSDSGYTNLCTGGPEGVDLASCPTAGRKAEDEVFVYLAADFTGASSGKYSTTLWFDLCNVALAGDIYPPAISHTPVPPVNMLGNRVVAEIRVVDDTTVSFAKLHYRTRGSSGAYKEAAFTLTCDSNLVYTGMAAVPAPEVPAAGIEYYITAGDGINTSCYSNAGYHASVPGAVTPIPVTVNRYMAADLPKNGGTITLLDANPNDGSTRLAIPNGALAAAKRFQITQADCEDMPAGCGAALSPTPVAAYEFEPDNTVFRRPVEMTLLYLDTDNDGRVELVDGTQTSIDENKLAVFMWDGFTWQYMGGRLDVASNTLRLRVTHFSKYAVFPARPLTADDYRPPQRVITPATKDLANDWAQFGGLSDTFEISIFDITGRLVIKIDENSPCGSRWDGVDQQGTIVESGVYIYQFKAPVDGVMKLISGTIAVAK